MVVVLGFLMNTTGMFPVGSDTANGRRHVHLTEVVSVVGCNRKSAALNDGKCDY